MTDSLRNWNTLPAEILREIFQLTVEPYRNSHLHQYALVCKAWLFPAQAVLYSFVNLVTLTRLKNFHHTMKTSSQLGKNVKKLRMEIFNLPSHSNAFDLLSDLLNTYLPNLEELDERNLKSYVPALNALKNSQMKRLKIINAPCPEAKNLAQLADYATCILLLKDRIENLEIFEEAYDDDAEIYKNPNFKRVYKELHHFDKLLDLKISLKKGEEIQAIENILAACKALKRFSFGFGPYKDVDSLPPSLNSNVPIEEMLSIKPNYRIKTLEFKDLIVTNDYKILLYLMHKFPLLDRLEISVQSDISPAQLDRDIFLRLLKYTADIDSFTAYDLPVNSDAITRTFSEFWKSISTPIGSQSLSVDCYKDFSEINTCSVSLSRNWTEHVTSLSFSVFTTSSHYIDFIKENGIYLKKFEFSNLGPQYELPPKFINQLLAYCPNIRCIKIDSSILRPFFHSKLNLTKKHSLDELFFSRSILYPFALEQLSMVIAEVKLMRINTFDRFHVIANSHLGMLEEVFDDLNVEYYLEIIMTYTSIGCIRLEHVEDRKVMQIKIFVVSEGVYRYYKYENKVLQISDEGEYNAKGIEDVHVYICCKTNPKLEFDHC